MNGAVEVYTLKQLLEDDDIDDRAKDKARYWLQEGYDWEWWDWTLEIWKDEKLPPLGFDNAKIHFSLGYSQGDGASFTADVDAYQFLKSGNAWKYYPSMSWHLQRELMGPILGAVTDSNYYGMCVEINPYDHGDMTDKCWDEFEGFAEAVREEAKSIAHDIYIDIRNEWEWMCEDEYMLDMAEANEYLFFDNGAPAHHLVELQKAA